jgi:hypothetical protein
MKISKFDDVPAGPTVSNKPSRLKANNILVSSWAILRVFDDIRIRQRASEAIVLRT